MFVDKLQLKAAIVLPRTRQIQARSTQIMSMVLSIYTAPRQPGPTIHCMKIDFPPVFCVRMSAILKATCILFIHAQCPGHHRCMRKVLGSSMGLFWLQVVLDRDSHYQCSHRRAHALRIPAVCVSAPLKFSLKCILCCSLCWAHLVAH